MHYQDVQKLAGIKKLADKIGHSYLIFQRESPVLDLKWLSLLLMFVFQTGFSQVLPKYNPLFSDAVVPSIYITMDADSLNALLDPSNWEEDHEYPATFVWSEGSKKDTLKNVGFRLRGNTSRQSAKKSFKVKFNHFGGEKYQGLSDLNLNGEHNDPSLSRAKIVWDLMRKAGIDAPRANHVLLFVNNEYKGIYLNVEHIDNDYFQARGQNGDGQIFKCLYGCDFVYRGSNPNSYPTTVYEPQNHKDEANFYDLIEFIRVLGLKDNANYRCMLEEVFEVDDYLKTMAMEVLVGHWDNPTFNKNNAYIYIPVDDKRVQLMSYDVDNTMGIDWLGEDWANKNIYSWAEPSDKRPLFYNLLSVPAFKNRYGYHIKSWMESFMKTDSIQQLAYQIRDRIKAYRGNDVYSELDYGFDYNDFIASFDQMNDRHVKYGIVEYFNQRLSTAKSQLQNTAVVPYFGNRKIGYLNGKLDISFEAYSSSPVQVELAYRFENEDWKTLTLTDNGQAGDVVANDHRYHFQWLGSMPGTFYYKMKAIDAAGKEGVWPSCESFEYSVGYYEVPKLYINEWMADNTLLKDNAGEAEDWVEIYNGGEEDIYLGQYYLSDDREKPTKWLMPDVTLPAKSWIYFWADEDGSQGGNHANFKLSKQGEFLGIFDNADNLYAPIDTLHFGACSTDKAYGRYPDGGAWVGELTLPTPGASNVLTAVTDIKNKITFYPNPASNTLIINLISGWTLDDIVSPEGKSAQIDKTKVDKGYQVDVQRLSPGLYFFKISGPDGRSYSAAWVKQ